MKYEPSYKYKNCLNCAHFKKPSVFFSGLWHHGCIEKMTKSGPVDFRKLHCGKWIMKSLKMEEY